MHPEDSDLVLTGPSPAKTRFRACEPGQAANSAQHGSTTEADSDGPDGIGELDNELRNSVSAFTQVSQQACSNLKALSQLCNAFSAADRAQHASSTWCRAKAGQAQHRHPVRLRCAAEPSATPPRRLTATCPQHGRRRPKIRAQPQAMMPQTQLPQKPRPSRATRQQARCRCRDAGFTSRCKAWNVSIGRNVPRCASRVCF